MMRALDLTTSQVFFMAPAATERMFAFITVAVLNVVTVDASRACSRSSPPLYLTS